MLIGRDAERAAVDRLLGGVRDGGSGSVVVRGEPGIGKSSILGYAAESAEGFRVLSVTGIESEMEIPFAALQQVCAPLTRHLDQIPGPQAAALRVAFGLSGGPPPDRFLVGLGVLSLAAEEAASRPLLCLADDAQWVDQTSLQSLAFAARRLERESVAMIFAGRSAASLPDLAGLPELVLGGLPEPEARSLLASVVPGRLDERVRARILAEASGNPLALLEFSHEVTEASELAGGFGVSPWLARPLADRVEERYLARVAALPAATQRLLLLAAAEPLGDPGLLGRAAGKLGMGLEEMRPAEQEGLVRLGSQVTFRHPLVRSAIYRSALAADRQVMHGVLAEMTDQGSDPDHRAWHRAHATFGPDAAVAADLERSAGRALARGGPAAASAFLERAAALSPDAGQRARRTLAAAQAKYDAGGTRSAAALLAAARSGPLGELEQAQADQLAARIMTATSRASEAPALLVQAATRFGPLDAGLARRTYLDAIMSAMIIGSVGGGSGWLDVARAARATPPAREPERADDLLLDGLTLLAADGYAAGLATLRRAIAAFLAEGPRTGASVGVVWLACRTAMSLWDDEAWHQLASHLVASARGAGTLIDLPGALGTMATVTLLSGDAATATALIDETATAAAAIGTYQSVHGPLALAAWQGRPAEEAGPKPLRGAGPGRGGHSGSLEISMYTAAVRDNGLGRYDEALAAAQRGSEHAGLLGYALWALPELVEAAARCGRGELAAAALLRLRETTSVSRTDWGLGMEARARALVSTDAAAEDAYQEAVARLGRTRIAAHLARAHLLYGEWLRREKRRIDARAELRTALEMFTAMEAAGFAQRAERELSATGERVRRRDVRPAVELTPQEAQIARLASEGQSNPEIAAHLFISPRTVEYHLHKIYAKLDISSRAQLARALGSLP
jgi:DNA-binding CsgD family transcriptional regulator